jgi:CheY-like chemotaxis protein
MVREVVARYLEQDGHTVTMVGDGAAALQALAGTRFDLVVLDLASTPAIAQRADHASDIWEAVFPTIMMGDDRAVAAVWVNGAPVVQP